MEVLMGKSSVYRCDDPVNNMLKKPGANVTLAVQEDLRKAAISNDWCLYQARKK